MSRFRVVDRVGGRVAIVAVAAIACAFESDATFARGASPYLPLNLAPEIERDIERVLILADKPVIARPLAAATVLDALATACPRDERLCTRVRRYLERYMGKIGLDEASIAVAASDGPGEPLPNERGMTSDSAWSAAALAHWQPADYAILSLGGVAYEDAAVPSGSMLSLGFDFAQLDIGYREHWFSPFTQSAMIISTEAQTLPSVTLSNYQPLTPFGLSYEVFLAEMEHSGRIAFNDGKADDDGFTSGRPRLAGLRFAIEPAAGWSLGANRMLQFGGGERGGRSLTDFLRALAKPHQNDNRSGALNQESEFGNQVAAWTSRFIFPGRTPFAVYFEYAGEDNSFEGNYRLGNASLSVGITIPQLWRRFDLTYEVSEWQNGWYAHGIYLDGLTNEGRVLGHWGADRQAFLDAVGAQTHLVRVGWEPSFGGLLQVQARTADNETYGSVDYERSYDVSVSYSRAIAGFTVGGEVTSGRDSFGESWGRIEGFARFGAEWAGGASAAWYERERSAPDADIFIDAGINASEVQIRLGNGSAKRTTDLAIAPHVAIGARRAVSAHSDLGARIEFDRIDDQLLVSVRAVDYRYRFESPLALTFFVGASRYDLATPAFGYYLGAGVQWRNLLPKLDVSLDVRYADKIARDKLLPTDPGLNPRPDSFYDVSGGTLSLSYRF